MHDRIQAQFNFAAWRHIRWTPTEQDVLLRGRVGWLTDADGGRIGALMETVVTGEREVGDAGGLTPMPLRYLTVPKDREPAKASKWMLSPIANNGTRGLQLQGVW